MHSPILSALKLPNLVLTGHYRDDDVRSSIEQNEPDYIALPSIFPETYMYTPSHAIGFGLPASLFNLGQEASGLNRMNMDTPYRSA